MPLLKENVNKEAKRCFLFVSTYIKTNHMAKHLSCKCNIEKQCSHCIHICSATFRSAHHFQPLDSKNICDCKRERHNTKANDTDITQDSDRKRKKKTHRKIPINVTSSYAVCTANSCVFIRSEAKMSASKSPSCLEWYK